MAAFCDRSVSHSEGCFDGLVDESSRPFIEPHTGGIPRSRATCAAGSPPSTRRTALRSWLSVTRRGRPPDPSRRCDVHWWPSTASTRDALVDAKIIAPYTGSERPASCRLLIAAGSRPARIRSASSRRSKLVPRFNHRVSTHSYENRGPAVRHLWLLVQNGGFSQLGLAVQVPSGGTGGDWKSRAC